MDQRLRKNDSRGASAVEFALVLPLLFLLIFGLIDFGRLFFAQISLEAMSREVVRASAMTLDSEHCTSEYGTLPNQGTNLLPDCSGGFLKNSVLAELNEVAKSVSPGTASVSTLGESETPNVKVENACSPLNNTSMTKIVVSISFKWITPISIGRLKDMKISSTGLMRCSG